MPNPLAIQTPRLELIAGNAHLARAALASNAGFSQLLNAHVPVDWPPAVLADVQDLFATWLETGHVAPGWLHWYVIRLPVEDDPRRILVGSAGSHAPAANSDTREIGYSILPAYERRGYATEATRALIEWLLAHPHIRALTAQTFERHHASARILKGLEFVCSGVSPADSEAADSDRQGRGRLMLYERKRPT